MNFHVLPPKTPIPKGLSAEFVLKQDYWNDYGYRTQYHLYFLDHKKKEDTFIGTVKILKLNQKDDMGFYIKEPFEKLDDFISVGQSIDYYERISSLPQTTRIKLLESLNDYLLNPDLGEIYKNQDAWKKSLFRDFSEYDNMLDMARSILRDNFELSNKNAGLKFSFHVSGWDNAIEFDFSNTPTSTNEYPFHSNNITPKAYDNELPSRVVAIIGRNGSGKSTLLARLARVAHATPKNRKEILSDSLGQITPKNIGFTRLITVSYSAFDSFRLPGVKPRSNDEPDERVQIIKDVEDGNGRFAFCGLRDIAAELKIQINGEQSESEVHDERVSNTLLKSIDASAEEFANTLLSAKMNGKSNSLNAAFECISRDPSFSSDTDEKITVRSLIERNPKRLFLGWSTGHKIVMQMLVSIAARTISSSLVLIDEPETHLHPPLLAALMHAIRKILEIEDAFAIIATHSPVVLQETLVRHVYLIRREGSSTRVFAPTLETFGANISELTTEAFGLNTETNDFYRILDTLVKKFKSLDEIESLFEPYGLSMQARAYVMSRLLRTEIV